MAETDRTELTSKVARLSAEKALELGIRHIVVASNSGRTAIEVLKAAREAFAGKEVPKVVCVTHMVGFSADGVDEMEPSARAELSREGVMVLTTTHLFGGVERSLSGQHKGIYPLSMIANALKLFGQGAKVAVEVSVMALDSGLIPHGEDVIGIGGSGRGADTALIIRPAHSTRFFDTRVKGVITLS